ncbi:hypothetical protein J1G42_15365 [Cellulomonas sp. zg-ZUI222]|uniref:DUF6492 family protein n=1 Tax=Cellulomonas wangleii TaxID=2816956 RepID=UPI001A948E22|nr:DUF6492 family protein [Cellulomonas wangleii]MBO0922201.1 hypothetical protein [Cellulomonas wangleii]
MSTGDVLGAGTVVTVVFELEVPLLLLQARSFARHVPVGAVAEVLVIDNTARGLPARGAAELLAAYGPHADRVTLLRPDDLGGVPAAPGWQRQQALKLLVAPRVTTGRYLALDAKNHLVRAPDPAWFGVPDGRARLGVHGYAGHPLRPALERTVRYLGLDPGAVLDRFPATVTPFVLVTSLVRAMVEDVGDRAGRPFAQEFVDHRLTEFFLYAAWLEARAGGRDRWYADGQPGCPVVWPGDPSLRAVRAAGEELDGTGAPVLSVHRTALVRMPADATDALTDLWVAHGLFAARGDAARFVAGFRRTYRRRVWVRRCREAPQRVRARLADRATAAGAVPV